MDKIYPEKVVKSGNKIFDECVELDVFEDFTITELECAKRLLFDELTTKFINDEYDEDIPIFSEEDFNDLINKMVVGSILDMMEDEGVVKSYEDDETEKVYFLTEKGKERAKGLTNTSSSQVIE